jgi:hypothetical protein
MSDITEATYCPLTGDKPAERPESVTIFDGRVIIVIELGAGANE